MTRLEFERRRKGFSQAELGQQLLYSRYVIGDLERRRPGKSEVSPRLAAALERYFKTPFEELMKDV